MTPRRAASHASRLVLTAVLAVACKNEGKPSVATPDSASAKVVHDAQEPCAAEATQLAMTACWTSAAAQAEALESAQFTKAMDVVKQKGSAEQSAALAVAEEQWKAYRDAQCRADAGFYAGGSAAETAAAVCRARHAKDRESTLERTYLDWAAR